MNKDPINLVRNVWSIEILNPVEVVDLISELVSGKKIRIWFSMRVLIGSEEKLCFWLESEAIKFILDYKVKDCVSDEKEVKQKEEKMLKF